MGHFGGGVRGEMPESSRVEFDEKECPKDWRFLEGELARSISANKRWKGRFQKIIEMLLAEEGNRRTKEVIL